MRAVIRVLVGMLSGILSAGCVLLFGWCVDRSSQLFDAVPALLALLPVAGVLTYALYKQLGVTFGTGTAQVVNDVKAGRPIRPALGAGVFAGTCATIAAGGTSGKEAAALQIGASVASLVGRRACRGKDDTRFLVSCGMAAALSCLLGTPLAAAAFAFELFGSRPTRPSDLVGVIASSLMARLLAWGFGAEALACPLAAPGLALVALGEGLAACLAAIAASVVFCLLLRYGRRFSCSSPTRSIAMLVAGGAAYACIVSGLGLWRVAGTGMPDAIAALGGDADIVFGVEKMALTALLLACGYKGGEIMPTLCFGAMVGGGFGALIGLDVPFCAGIGMVAAFSACTNCPVASLLLGCEAFGLGGLPFWAAASVLAYVLTSRISLYDNTHRIGRMPRSGQNPKHARTS